MSINVVLDIDGVLACKSAGNIEAASFFKNKGAILTAIKTHYIFPGVIEFIKLLFETEGVRVSFFSLGDESRNEVFVKKLLKLSLGKNKYEEIKETVSILSRNNFIECGREWQEHYRLYNLRPGKKQKDLSKVLKGEEELKNTILIDDDSSYVACGQAKNFLSLPATERSDYQRLLGKYELYQPSGFKFLRCVLSCEPREVEAVKEGKLIYLVRSNDQFFLNYLDKDSVVHTEPITGVQNQSLVEKLTQLHEKNLEKKRNTCLVEDQELIKNICELVGSLGGNFQKICRTTNRIYYAAGLLLTALEKAKQESLSISESLFRLQFKLKQDNETYEPNFKKLRKTDSLYLIGLEKLKHFNDELQLTNPVNYSQFTKLIITEEEKILLESFIENEDNGCCIM